MLFITKSFLNELDLRDMFRHASKIIYMSTVVVSADPWFPTPSSSSALKTPENTEEDPDGDIQTEYCADQLYSPSIGAVKKNTCKNLGQYRYYLIIRIVRSKNTKATSC
jgi:hypothetical protein